MARLAPGGAADGTLSPSTSWGREDDPGAPPPAELLARYRPPFTFTSDHLFVAACCPTAPLRRTFPGTPFISLAGRTPVLAWFSRVHEGCALDDAGRWRCEAGADGPLYHEVTFIVPLWRRALFVPGIYATSRRSALLARHYYGMPKEAVAIRLRVRGGRVEAHGLDRVCRSWARGRIVGPSRGPARLLERLWPLRVWPVLFPAGTHARGVIEAAPRTHLVTISGGQLAVGAPWLPEAAALLPLGLYVPGLRMRLLPP